MARGAAMSEGSGGELIHHFSTVRLRANGVGSIKLAVYSLDDVKSKSLAPLTISKSARIIPTRIVNFVEQRASFELKQTETRRLHESESNRHLYTRNLFRLS